MSMKGLLNRIRLLGRFPERLAVAAAMTMALLKWRDQSDLHNPVPSRSLLPLSFPSPFKGCMFCSSVGQCNPLGIALGPQSPKIIFKNTYPLEWMLCTG